MRWLVCGILGFGGEEGPQLIQNLLGTLRRRGPDGSGSWTSSALSLGHRRLSIIGLHDDGLQPMVSRSGESVLVCNGEIYNYLELADELQQAGRGCDRRFDTSVLLEALEFWGRAALEKCNGMFALAWYRPSEDRVLLARDRWGKKPLFWGRYRSHGGGRHLAFSSEFRTFDALPTGAPKPDNVGVARYLVYGGMVGERTVYEGVSKVPAGSWVETDGYGRVHQRGDYWRFEVAAQREDLRQATASTTSALSRALDLRLRSDVPVGLLLSGGIDSSILAAMWRRKRPGDRIRTFTLGFDDESYDERASAAAMARAIDSEHHEIVLSGNRLAAAVNGALDSLPEPLADPSFVPTSLLCQFAAGHVKVAIGGDGADELQAGYDPFRAWATAKLMTSVMPGVAWNRVLRIAERWAPASGENLSLQFKLHHFRQGLPHPRTERAQAWMANFPVGNVLQALKPELVAGLDPESIMKPSRDAYSALTDIGELHAQIHSWLATYLESSILAKIDRAGMMHSLEVRSPFLDPTVAAELTNLSPKLIFDRGKGKVVLRELARDLVPRCLLRKPKKGFGVPLGTWFKTVLRDRMEQAIEASATTGWFRHSAVRQLWADQLAGRYDNRLALWSFLAASAFASDP